MSLARALGRYTRAARPRTAHERCELCAAPLAVPHPHVVELEQRRMLCACRPCALLFSDPAAARGRYRTVPDRVRHAPELALDAAAFDALGVPVRLAFFFYSSPLARWVAVYPSPAGATEAELDASALDALPIRALFDAAEHDVEAVLARRPRGAGPAETFLVPIDLGYELVALMRRHWRGLEGGASAQAEIDALFDRVRGRSRPIEGGRR